MSLDVVESASSPLARFKGEPILELPSDLYIPPEALQVILEAFEGPLDLLLYLIRKHNLDVLDIPMADLTRQYLQYVPEFFRSSSCRRIKGIIDHNITFNNRFQFFNSLL